MKYKNQDKGGNRLIWIDNFTASSICNRFSSFKRRLQESGFNDMEVKTAATKWLKEKSTEFYKAGIHTLIRTWNIAIERSGDYVRQ